MDSSFFFTNYTQVINVFKHFQRESGDTNIDRNSYFHQSGLKVNEAKTEICLFSRTNMPPVLIKISNQEVETKNQINVLGIIFDSNLKWGPQVTSTLKKANKALNAIRLIKNYFTSSELLQLVTSNFFSVLYYNSEVWHHKTLNQSMKSKLLSTSAKALKLCAKPPTCG